MSKGLKITYVNNIKCAFSPGYLEASYNGKGIHRQYNSKDGCLKLVEDIAKSISGVLLTHKIKFHPKNIERLIKEALRENNRGLRIEIIIEGKTILKISYNGKLLHQEAYVDWKGMAEICKGSGKKADLWSKDISELLRMNTDVKYHPENIKRILKDAWRNRKVVPVKSSKKGNI